MFGTSDTILTSDGQVAATALQQDASLPQMAQPVPQQIPQDHQMTPAYPVDEVAAAPSTWVAGLADDVPSTAMMMQPIASSTPIEHPADHELMGIKQDALNALAPLVSQLEQTAEEKFRTTMMMIQASDDRTLVRSAYEAAQAITDEKVRAQALLDVINEINYFTAHVA